MKTARLMKTAILLCSFSATGLNAQEPQPTKTTFAPVPRVLRWNSSFRPTNGQPAVPVESITLSVYQDQKDSTPLWSEMQNVSMDADGHYTLLIGSTIPDGIPADLFSTGAQRWLGVQFNRPGEAEQPRVLLASVPYALKAADAETLGRLPASAYLTAGGTGVFGALSNARVGSKGTQLAVPTANSGTPGFVGRFVNTLDLGNSVLFDTGSRIGAGTTNPQDIITAAFNNGAGNITGFAVQNTSTAAGAYSGMLFYDQNGALGQFQGFNNSTHEYRVNNIASNGTINFMISGSSKFLVRNDGDIDLSGNVRKGGSLFINTADVSSAGLGRDALANNTGFHANAVGFSALGAASGNSGSYNNAFGAFALASNTTGSSNNAHGDQALQNNTTGSSNSAFGDSALLANNGFENTAVGVSALRQLTTGTGNLGLGTHAGDALSGAESGNIMLTNIGVVGDNNTTRIGSSQTRAFIAGVRGAITGVGNAVTVVIDSNGQLGTINSSRRFKEDIQDMGAASTDLMRLRPVTYRYKQPYADGSKPLDYGLIAEEVLDFYPDLVVRDKDGEVETVQYQKLTPMLLNELQKQNQRVQQQDKTMAQQRGQIQKLEARLTALEALLSGRESLSLTAAEHAKN